MIEGSCHCGAVRWSFDGAPAAATACSCTVCRRYGALWIYGFENEHIRTSGETLTYVRDKGRLGFHFCGRCGCIAYWRPIDAGDDGRRRMGVNIRLAEPGAVADIPLEHLDGLGEWQERLEGRVADIWF